MKLVIVFDQLPPAELSPNKRLHWAKKALLVAWAKHDAYMLAKDALHILGKRSASFGTSPWEIPEHSAMHIEIAFPDKRRRDWDNLLSSCKAWIDGIREAGVVRDDDWQHLSISLSGHLGKKAMTRITISADNTEGI